MEDLKLQEEFKKLKTEIKKLQSQLDVYETFYEQPDEMDEKWRYRYLFMTMAQGVIYQDQSGAIISANPSALNILGISLHHILGKSPKEEGWVAIDELGNTIPIEFQPAMQCLATGRQVGPFTMGVLNHVKHDYVWINVTSIPLFRKGENVPYQVYTSFEDITEHKKLTTQFQLLFNEMLDGFIVFEVILDEQQKPEDFRFLAVNNAFEKITGMKAEQVIGHPLTKLIPDLEPIWIQLYGKVLANGKPLQFRQYTSVFQKTLEVKAFTAEPGKLAVMFSDVSHLVEVENKLCEEKTRAEAANRVKSQFLANMNHELRTPLNGLMGMHQLLKLTPLDEEQSGYVRDALSCCQSLTHIVDEILTYSKLEKGPDELVETHFQPCGLLSEIVRLHLPAAKSKGLILRHSTDKDLPPYIFGDRYKIKQVLMLLTGNAIKFTPEGEVHLSVSVSRKLTDGSLELKFSVQDTGIGIPSDKLDTIFDRFIQADDSHTRKYGGLGLGLTAAREVSRKLNGRLMVESIEHKGSCFSFVCILKDKDIDIAG